MSRLKFSSNLFIELAEIQKAEKFIIDEGYKMFLRTLINQYGIYKCDNPDNILYGIASDSFSTFPNANYNDVVTINPGVAIDPLLNIILKTDKTDIQIPNDGVKKWIVVAYDTHNYEQGVIDINANGQVTGYGTEFTKVLRGYNNFPNKIKVESSNQLFEVVDVISDTLAHVNINQGSAVSQKKYSVTGSFTPGFIPSSNDLLIYEYDFYKVSVISSPNPPLLLNTQYLLASVEYDNNNVLIVNDERSVYFNESESSTQLNNKFLSLVSTAVVNNPIRLNNQLLNKSFEIELNLQINCKIVTFTPVNNNEIILNQIQCNALNDTVPIGVDVFKNCWLYNYANGKKTIITSSNNNQIFFDVSNDNDFWTNNPDLCILPECIDDIEFEIKNDGTPNQVNNNNIFSYNISDISSRGVKVVLPILSSDDPNIDYVVSVKYRFRKNGQFMNNLPQISFINYLNIAEIPGIKGEFSITPYLLLNDIIENYS